MYMQVVSYWLPIVKNSTAGGTKPIILAGNKVQKFMTSCHQLQCFAEILQKFEERIS